MKKYLIAAIMILSLLLSGCETNQGGLFFPSADTAELYYNTNEEIRLAIKRDDVDRADYYKDLFLAEGISAGMNLEEVLYGESREALLDISNTYEVYFAPNSTANTVLSKWINNAVVKYEFDQDEIVERYELVNTSNNSYTDYLYIMRALSLKYGECTTELYKNGTNVIDSSKVKKDYKTMENIIEFYENSFQMNQLTIVSQWIQEDYKIIVNCSSPQNISVSYEFSRETSTQPEQE